MHPIALLRYLRFPLHTTPMLLILFIGIVLSIVLQGGMFGAYVVVVLGSFFFKYGFALLDDVIDGHRMPPVMSTEFVNPFERRSFGLLLLLIAFYALTAMLQSSIGDVWVVSLRVLLLAIVPSMIATMSITGRVIDALNPVAVIGTILRIPIAYVSLLITISALWFIPIWALKAVSGPLPNLWRKESFLPLHMLSEVGMHGFLTGLIAIILFMYLWLAMFACIGGTIFARRKELDVDSAHAPERIAARVNAELDRERDKIMDRVFAQVRGGAFANAGNSVRRLVEQSAQPLEECRWIYARAAAAVDQRLANYLAQLMLPRLLSAKATGEALKLTRERLAVAIDFRPETSGQLLQLAQLARDAGDRATSRRLLADFDQRYPNDALASMAKRLYSALER